MKITAPVVAAATSVPARANFAISDFLKLLAGAVASGVTVSLAAAGIALALAGSVQAAPSVKRALISSVPKANSAQPAASSTYIEPGGESFPGSLRIGGGCDSEPIDAQEREWMVSIEGNKAKVRVMQSFNMPLDAGSVAFFDAAIPHKSELMGLTVYSAGRTWQGRVMTAGAMAKLDRDGFQALDKQGVVLMWVDGEYLSTDQIINLAPGEVVTVEYTYATDILVKQGTASLALNLAPYRAGEANVMGHDKPRSASGTVWVEFIGALPSQLNAASGGMVLDQTPNGIRGGSWYNPALDKAEKFSFVWDVSKIVDAHQRVAQQ